MSLVSRCKSFLVSVLRRRRMEREMEAELNFHLASYTEDLVRSGVARDKAERMARIEFGPGELLKDECRQALGLRLLDETGQDIRYTARMLRKSPGFAATAVFTLAVGIGLNTAIFSVVNQWVLHPLAYPNSDRLMAIWTINPKYHGLTSTSAADLYDWRQANAAKNEIFEEICGWTASVVTLIREDEPKQFRGALVSAEFFRMLGVAPQLGRDFVPEDDQPGAPPVALLSDGLWHDLFGADPDIVGTAIPIDGTKTTIVGIMPSGFHLPVMGRNSLWMPLALSAAERANRDRLYLSVIARTRPGVDVARARRYLSTVADQLATAYPVTSAGNSITLTTLADELGRKIGKEPILFTFALVGCVLLLACANVSNLIVGRALRRQQEMAVRLAMGAGRFRLLRQLLTENLVLFLLAGALSAAFAVWGVRWIENSLSYEVRGSLPYMGALRVNMPTLLYAFAVAGFTGIVFGFAPALHCWRVDVHRGLKGSSSQASSGESIRLKSLLVVLEMSLALTVVVAAGLLVKGMTRIYADDPGFNPRGLITARLLLSDSKYTDLHRARAFFDDLVERIGSLPGIRGVAAAQLVPFDGRWSVTPYTLEGQPETRGAARYDVILDAVTPDYFSVMGITLLRGRFFSEQDREASDVVGVINQTMARRHWADENPIGKRIRFGGSLNKVFTIVGVVGDTEGQSENNIPRPQAYIPAHQSSARSMTLVIRPDLGTQSNAIPLFAAVRRATREVDPGQAVYSLQTMEDLESDWFNPIHVAGQMMMLLGGIALILAVTGIYSVMAYAVAARRKEFGIRLALGAAPRDLLSMVVGQGMKLAGLGFAIGLAASLAETRFMSMILFHVSPTDLPTFTLTSVLLLLVATLACYLPARQAASVEPMRVLHHE
ncbi:MAG TPA: ABC transporter permease [Terriglobales bacterium]|jgi:predicted permease|nr:ABC transporter permease [Terriglobales bacterium]